MNAPTGKLTLAAVVLIAGVLSSEQSTSAHGNSRGNCREVQGKWFEVYPGTGNVSTGTITKSEILRGKMETVFDGAALPTPDPDTVSFTADLTITTNHGKLKARSVFLFDLATGLWTVIERINPDTSTGRFAGATGALFPSGTTIRDGLTYSGWVIGEICFAGR
jgi:hypothetical protein